MKLFLLLAAFVNSTDAAVAVEQKATEQQKVYKLSWETKNPDNKAWTQIVLDKVDEQFPKLDLAEDVEQMCPNYKNLEREDKKWVWGELISSMAFYESGWNPTAQLEEPPLGIDTVTGVTVMSEGLLQMGYGDTVWAPFCRFDWEKDKKLPAKSPKKTVMKPKNNLECGIQILANQINKHKKIFVGKGAYWSVIKTNSKYQKLKEIKSRVKAIPQCHVEPKDC